MMTTTELFLQAMHAYKAWIHSGMDFMNFGDLYEKWDSAILEFARAADISRSEACTQVYVAVGRVQR